MRQTHHHEAAHAVFALWSGLRVTDLRIGREELNGVMIEGVCAFVHGGVSDLALAEIYLAGPAVESMMDHNWNYNEINEDYLQAGLLLENVVEDITAVVAKVKQRVNSLFPEIDRLAKVLLEHKRLDEHEIMQIARMPAWRLSK